MDCRSWSLQSIFRSTCGVFPMTFAPNVGNFIGQRMSTMVKASCCDCLESEEWNSIHLPARVGIKPTRPGSNIKFLLFKVPWFQGSKSSRVPEVSKFQKFHRSRVPGFQVSGFQCSRVPGFQGSRAPGFQSSRVPELQGSHGSRVPGFQRSRVPGFQRSRVPGFQGSKVSGFQGSRVPFRILKAASPREPAPALESLRLKRNRPCCREWIYIYIYIYMYIYICIYRFNRFKI